MLGYKVHLACICVSERNKPGVYLFVSVHILVASAKACACVCHAYRKVVDSTAGQTDSTAADATVVAVVHGHPPLMPCMCY